MIPVADLGDLYSFVSELLQRLGAYADGSSEDANAREERRNVVEPELPDVLLTRRRAIAVSPVRRALGSW